MHCAMAGDATREMTHDEVEAFLESRGRELLRLLRQGHLDVRARAEREEERNVMVRGADGRLRPYRETGHRRLLACLFGTVTVERCTWRAKGPAGVRPADAVLSLPAGRQSAHLTHRVVLEAVRGSYDQAKAALDRGCGKVVGKRQAEQLVVEASRDIDAFYDQKIPAPATAESVLVLQADAKGIVMRPGSLREATRKALAKNRTARCRIAPGEKANRKRMATLACVFDAEPAPRRPQDVIAPPQGRSGERTRRPGPRARAKWLTGSVTDGPAAVIAAAFDQAKARDPGHVRDWLCLVDAAAHQLDLIRTEAERRGIELHVLLDFVHVMEYAWAAAHCFYRPGSPEAQAWVGSHLTTILHSQAARAAAEIEAQATRSGLARSSRKGATDCVRYLTGHLDQLHYDLALKRGWPIATGAIEGACRHIIGDRLAITGARWGLAGAEAILKFRTLIDNGDFDTFWIYHRGREHERLYPAPSPYQLAA
ncbi:ISKra4 family transposase [Streptomyces sp. NPDC048484]|uniref:ISKra4 family transposase n=1 Tax=Streptomyces sp. NPDC048484 TaxID=3155146 RepID=UPI0034169FCF